jgi:glucosamine--fructose-6-phosphate aminotransferase (isomerizing)
MAQLAISEERKPGQHTYHEIITQGDVWRATMEGFQDQSKAILKLLEQPFEEIIFTGCGSTYYLSLAAAAVWKTLTGMRAIAIPASELWLYPDLVLSSRNTLLIAVSRSGTTTETIQAIRTFRKNNGLNVLGISVYPESDLTQEVPLTLIAHGAGEKSVAQTRSFSSMYLMTQMLAYQKTGDERALQELQSLPNRFQSILSRYETLSQQLATDPQINQFIFLGSGWNFGLASEVMLKMKEMSLSISEAFHFLEYRHGPKSMVCPETLIIGLLGDNAIEQELNVLKEMRTLGAKVLALADQDKDIPADFLINLHSGLPDISRSILKLPLLQLLAFYRSMNKGLNPDRPNNLEAVVRL